MKFQSENSQIYALFVREEYAWVSSLFKKMLSMGLKNSNRNFENKKINKQNTPVHEFSQGPRVFLQFKSRIFSYMCMTFLSWADELCYGCAARCRIGCFIFLCARVWIVQVLMNNTLYHQAYIEGYTELLGISTYCRLNLTMTRMELLIQGNFLNLIKAELFVFAAYSYLFPSAEFYVRVTVDLSGINNVSNFLCAPFLKII